MYARPLPDLHHLHARCYLPRGHELPHPLCQRLLRQEAVALLLGRLRPLHLNRPVRLHPPPLHTLLPLPQALLPRLPLPPPGQGRHPRLQRAHPA